MNVNQLQAAEQNMIEWLADPHELGKAPSKIECTGQFEYREMNYYLFKFKTGILGKWLMGVSGGFEGDSLEPCGHTFSDMNPYNEETAVQEAIQIIGQIVAYWQEQARLFDEQ